MIRRLRVASVFLVLMAVLVLPAQAGLRFCSADPIFEVGRKGAREKVDVLVQIAAPPGLLAQITQGDPVKVFLKSPKGTDPKVVWVGGEFTEEAYASEHRKKDQNSVEIVVKVPERLTNHPEYRLRVTVHRGKDPVAQKETDRDTAKLSFDWFRSSKGSGRKGDR